MASSARNLCHGEHLNAITGQLNFYYIFKASNTPLNSTEYTIKRKQYFQFPENEHFGLVFVKTGSINSGTYLTVNCVVSYPPPLQKGHGEEWGKSLLLVEHICICLLIFKTTKRKRERTEMGRERMKADLMSLNRHFMQHGQLHA